MTLPAAPPDASARPTRGWRRARRVVGLSLALASLAATIFLAFSNVPLGIRAEWTWNRQPEPLRWTGWLAAMATLSAYAGLVFVGRKLLRQSEAWALVLLPCLLAAAAAWQATILHAAAIGTERWPVALIEPASSGYFLIGRSIRDPYAFVREYPRWIRAQDNFHVGTHPPGLFLLSLGAARLAAEHPRVADRVLAGTPANVRSTLADAGRRHGLVETELAAVLLIAMATWGASLATCPLLYLLARTVLRPPAAWIAAACWPLVPAAILFLPISDALYPPLAVLASVFAGWSMKPGRSPLAFFSGLALFAGMTLSLAFLALSAFLLLWFCLEATESRPQRRRSGLVLKIFVFGAGVVLPAEVLRQRFGIDLWSIWRTNLEKHAGFYDIMPRSTASWMVLNLVEAWTVLGPSVASLALVGVFGPCRGAAGSARRLLLAWWLTLFFLNLSGRNLAEVARLWLFLFPFASIGAGTQEGEEPGGTILGIWVFLQGFAAAALVGAVEPLLPIALPQWP